MIIIMPKKVIGIHKTKWTTIIIDPEITEFIPNATKVKVPKNSKLPIFPGNDGMIPERFVIAQTIRIMKNKLNKLILSIRLYATKKYTPDSINQIEIEKINK